jgi:gas vesicle protein
MGKHRSGLILGLIAGTALGILFAPKKGKELREEIKQEREEGGHGLESVKDGFVDMGKEVVATARTAYESDEVQEKIGEMRESAEELAEEGKKRVRKVAKKVKRRAKTTAKRAGRKAASTVKRAGRKAGKFTRKKISK